MPLIFERTQTQFENLKTLRYDPDTLRLHQLYKQSTELEKINTELVKESIVLTMSNFNNNTVPLILTGGGPGTATNVISLELYRMGFTYYKFGLASALSVLVFLVNIVFVVLYVRMIKYDV